MKKKYVKPLIEKVDFKFTEHIAASGENYEGGQYNNNNTNMCNFRTIGCILWA